MIGAVISVGIHRERRDQAPLSDQEISIQKSPTAIWDLVGASLLHRFLHQIRAHTEAGISLVLEQPWPNNISLPSFATLHHTNERGFWPIWNAAVQAYISQGVDALLLVRLGPYSEVDVRDLIVRHTQTDSSFTQVFTDHGPIDMVIVKGSDLADGMGTYRNRLLNMSPRRRRYRFIGYTNELQSVEDFRRLTRDALWGKCRIRPIGKEIRPGVWVGVNARIDPTARMDSPVYVGDRSRVGSACTLAESTTVERDCEIDSATVVRDCNILPFTYLGAGLSFENAVVRQRRLFNIGRQVELNIRDGRLLQAIRPRTSMIMNRIQGVLKVTYRNIRIPEQSTLNKASASVEHTKSQGAVIATASSFQEGLRMPSQGRNWEKSSQ